MAVDPNSTVPVYRQIVEHIRRAVAAGVYRPGETIPSLRALALEMLVNPNTVQRAYEELERLGLILSRRGIGMVVTDDGVATARRQAEAAVHTAFSHGIYAGRAAGLPEPRIRAAFETAWHDHSPSPRSEP